MKSVVKSLGDLLIRIVLTGIIYRTLNGSVDNLEWGASTSIVS